MTDQDAILQRLERGEISAAAAVDLLTANGEGARLGTSPEPITALADDHPVQTRRERLDAINAPNSALEPHFMATLPGLEPSPWPWPEEAWQWIWQDSARPQHVDHTLQIAAGSQVDAVLYEGDVRLAPAIDDRLHLGSAAFDLRLGQEGRRLRLAASGGTLDLGLPAGTAGLEVQTLPGDLWLEDIEAQRARLVCHSGHCRCRRLRGDLDVELRGSDAVLEDITGDLRVRAQRGSVQARGLQAATVDIEADEGIDIELGRVKGGHFRCVVHGGDLNVSLAAAAAADLTVDALEGGSIAPCRLPWSTLHERSAQRLKGSIGGGGARIELVAHGGRIYLHAF